MRKKSVRRHHAHVTHAHKADNYVVLVRGWMFVVAIALMLGIGAIMGTFFKAQMEQSVPQVAGVSIEVK